MEEKKKTTSLEMIKSTQQAEGLHSYNSKVDNESKI